MVFYTNPAAAGGTPQSILTLSSQTANFNAVANYLYQVNATTGTVLVTLPTPAASQSMVVKKTDSSANPVNLFGTINGVASATYSISRQNQSKTIYADGSNGWLVVSGDIDLATLSSSLGSNGYLTTAGASKMTIGTTAPSSPAVGDLWVDTN